MATSPELLPKLVDSLAFANNYRLEAPTAMTNLKAGLYAFALCPQSQLHNLFFPEDSSQLATLSSVDKDFTLTEAQSRASGGVSLGEYSASRRGKLCGHVFKPGDHAKQGHDVTMSVHVGVGAGCCDCGDAEAFKEGYHLDCKYHSLVEEQSIQTRSPELEQALVQVAKLLRIYIEWMTGVLEQTTSSASPLPSSVEEFLESVNGPGSETPLASATSSSSWFDSSTLVELPDGTLSQSSLPARQPEDYPEADEDTGNIQQQDSSIRAGSAPYMSSVSRGKAREQSNGPWTVMLWNDEKHSFDQVIGQVHQCGLTRQEASDIAIRVDSYGRSPVITTHDVHRLLRAARKISSIELAVTICDALHVFREHVAGEIVSFMRDLCSANIGGEGGLIAEVLVGVLLEKSPDGLSRFQRLLGADERLWKKARKDLAELFVVLLGVSHAAKVNFSVQYAGMYSSIAESYLLSDREPEHSIIFYGVQVFTVPSVSALLIEVGFFSRILSILYAFFTEQTLPDDKKRLLLPPRREVHSIRLSSSAFRQKRYFQLFSDLNHLISSAQVHAIICKEPSLLEDLVYMLQLFSLMNMNERATQTHVEFESDTWVTAFNVTIQLGKICRSFGEAFRGASVDQVLRAAGYLLEQMADADDGFRPTPFAGKSHQLVRFSVANQPVSFHHPLPWLFAEIMKSIPLLSRTASAESLPADLRLDMLLQHEFLVAMEQPLRVIALIGQIKAGVWVRNGFGIRAQQLHYKEYSLRENTFDQDLYFMQCAFLMVNPEVVLASIVHRFDLASGSDEHSVYDASQLMTMWEELLHLLITLLSDPTCVTGMSDEAVMRRELIHNLCLGPSTYSDLMRRISERFADDASIEKTLADVSTFKAPSGTADQGTYSVRADLYTQVNPYFARFSRNQREDAEKAVREQLRKTTGQNEPVIVPTRLDLVTPLDKLMNVFECEELYYILYRSLLVGRPREGSDSFSEVLIDEALHLCMLAIVERPQAFARMAQLSSFVEIARQEGVANAAKDCQTLLHMLVQIESNDKLKPLAYKARWVLDQLGKLAGPHVDELRGKKDTSAEDNLEAKRKAAKARQAAIMKQFAQAQQTFFEQTALDDEDDEDEDVGMQDDTDAAPASLGACIVCQDELNSSTPFGALTMIQSTAIIREVPAPDSSELQVYVDETMAMPESFDRSAASLRPFGRASRLTPVDPDDESGDGLSPGIRNNLTANALYASACGHMMHLTCFDSYFKSIEQRHQLQPTRCHPENVSRNEFTCPLCKSLGNVLMPVTVESEVFPADKDDTELAQWALGWSNPIEMFVEQGLSALEAQEMLRKADALTTDRGRGLRPWRISLTLPSMLPREFAAGEPLMTHRLLLLLDPLVQEFYGSGTSAFLPEEIAKTISILEIASRGSGDSVTEVSEATIRMLKSFFIILANLVHVQTGDVQSLVTAALASLPRLGGIFAYDDTSEKPIGDPLATLVSLASVMPADFYNYVGFAFYNEILLLWQSWMRRDINGRIATDMPDSNNFVNLSGLTQIAAFFGSANTQAETARSRILAKLVYPGALAFLRRAAVIHRVLFGDANPSASLVLPDPEESEFVRLLAVLRIPSPQVVLSIPLSSSSSSSANSLNQHVTAIASRCFDRETRQLLARPVVNRPTELEHHSLCGGSVGIFYLIKSNCLLYLYAGKGAFSNPPYLDSHGEVDMGGR
ncbi:E3 ubiquitin-protein ligase ubr1 [Microbotryomycetes sp. JL201]|nr:E3 ubiquitin-protein ligase ubr1 [Microbotryomycetes sp. JL201]